MNRYSVTGDEGEWEPGSDGRVLTNKLGITEPADVEEAELELLWRLYDEILPLIGQTETITTSMIREWHRKWLGSIYSWAGRERSVDLVKDGFAFAHAARIPDLLEELDREVLRPNTPCEGMRGHDLVRAIAMVHVELILIHPFREGNGRIARFVADVMASQAGRSTLDYTTWDEPKSGYIAAIHAGMDCDYEAMERLVSRALDDGTGSSGI